MFDNFIAVLADTRVGSTALGSGLDNGENIFFLGEILYPEEIDSGQHLYRALLDQPMRKLAANRQAAFEFLDDFFSCGAWERGKRYVFDIKYHDLRLIPSHPAVLFDRPVLLEYLIARNIRILHINRRNKLAAALSQEVAIQTQLFHSSQGIGAARDLVLPLYEVVSGALARQKSHEAVRSWLASYSNVFDIEYEALFAEDGPGLLNSFLQTEWNIQNATFKPQLQKLSAVSEVSVANAGEIAAAFAEFPGMFDVKEALEPYIAALPVNTEAPTAAVPAAYDGSTRLQSVGETAIMRAARALLSEVWEEDEATVAELHYAYSDDGRPSREEGVLIVVRQGTWAAEGFPGDALRPLTPAIDGVTIVAKSPKYGEIGIAVAAVEDNLWKRILDMLLKQSDDQVTQMKGDLTEILARLDKLEVLVGSSGGAESRLAALESRLDAAEVFFVRIDEAVRRLGGESKKRRRRFLGIF